MGAHAQGRCEIFSRTNAGEVECWRDGLEHDIVREKGVDMVEALSMSIPCVMQVAYEVAQGLAFLHANNIVHFDLKSGPPLTQLYTRLRNDSSQATSMSACHLHPETVLSALSAGMALKSCLALPSWQHIMSIGSRHCTPAAFNESKRS